VLTSLLFFPPVQLVSPGSYARASATRAAMSGELDAGLNTRKSHVNREVTASLAFFQWLEQGLPARAFIVPRRPRLFTIVTSFTGESFFPTLEELIQWLSKLSPGRLKDLPAVWACLQGCKKSRILYKKQSFSRNKKYFLVKLKADNTVLAVYSAFYYKSVKKATNFF
jgi:hypothetical protein